MKKRYVICVDGANAEQENKITALIKSINLGWWHRMGNVWLVYDSSDRYTALTLRDALRKEVPSPTFLVLALDDGGARWGGFGAPEMFKWLHRNWSGE